MNLPEVRPVPNTPLSPDNYIGAEKFALLCEGDRTGYEAALLREWRDAEVPNEKKFDIWPCGTSDGLFAMADAIGRTVRIVAVEDRDFRDVNQAEADCKVKFADRERRNIAMRGWMAWQRNEVENYLLDQSVLNPAMIFVYRCTNADVLTALDQAITLLYPFQALQGALADVRRGWDATDPSMLHVASRPVWTASGLQPVDPALVESTLVKTCGDWRDKFIASGKAKEPFLGQQVVDSYKARLATCAAITRVSPAWLTDWAGKEILKLVRQQLASKFEGPGREPNRRIPPVQWHTLKNSAERNALDREIERAIQPTLVKELWNHAKNNSNAPIRADLTRLQMLLDL